MSPKTAILAAIGRLQNGDGAGAVRDLEALVRREPDSAEAHNALGSALGVTGRTEPAIAAFQRAIALRSPYPEASTNLGSALLEDGRVLAAREAFEAAVASGRAPLQAHAGLGRAWCLLGRFREAGSAFDRAVAHPKAHAAIHSERCYASLLDPEADASRVIAVHRDYDERIARRLFQPTRFENDENPERRLVLGYVSADFREHSVAHFIEKILKAHDDAAVELVAYSDAAREDATTERFRAVVPRFSLVARLSNAELVQRIRSDRVDVLLDLAGHMQPNRLPVFAAAPAPVLFTYLGYPGSTGMSAFHGRITDGWADPTADTSLAGPEAQIRVEGGYFAYTPPADAPDVSALPAETSGVVTFGSTNDLLKVSDQVLVTWAEILRRVPTSRLFVKAKALSSPELRERVLGVLARAGVAESRVRLAGPTSRREHQLAYSDIDVFLDPFPYSGATTTAEALWMGVPVLTLAGDRHAARLSTSILRSVGLDELVTESRDEYVRSAVRIAGDIEGLARLRRSLRELVARSPLVDGARVARAIERASREHFRRWARSTA